MDCIPNKKITLQIITAKAKTKQINSISIFELKIS